jgi:hypothetical protein
MIDYPEGLPCWAPGAADYLASMLSGKEVAVEWGGGASSVWLAPKVFRLHVVEHDLDWIERIAAATDQFNNVTIHRHPFTDPFYVNVLANMERAPVPHVWLIDGFKRIDCLAYVLERAQADDIVVCDDSADYLDGKDPDYAETFSQPHPHAGLPITSPKHKVWRNTLLTHHHATKDTTIWRV